MVNHTWCLSYRLSTINDEWDKKGSAAYLGLCNSAVVIYFAGSGKGHFKLRLEGCVAGGGHLH